MVAFPFALGFDQVLCTCLNPILQNTFLEVVLLITEKNKMEIMSNTCNEEPSEKHSRTASSFQPVLHEMEYILQLFLFNTMWMPLIVKA